MHKNYVKRKHFCVLHLHIFPATNSYRYLEITQNKKVIHLGVVDIKMRCVIDYKEGWTNLNASNDPIFQGLQESWSLLGIMHILHVL